MRNFHPNTIRSKHGRNAHSHEILQMLGLNPKAHLPDEGMSSRQIQGVRVWVTKRNAPLSNGRKGMAHRVMCECPRCGQHLSVGRLHQHDCRLPGHLRTEVSMHKIPNDSERIKVRVTVYQGLTVDEHISDVFERDCYVGTDWTDAGMRRARNDFLDYIKSNFLVMR